MAASTEDIGAKYSLTSPATNLKKFINLKIGGGKVVIILYKISFMNWYALGRSILHEYYHTADYKSVVFKKEYLKNVNKLGNNKEAMIPLLDWMEERAYKFIFNLGDPTSVYEDFKYLYHK